EFVPRRRVADFNALVAEIEFQIFAGVGFLLAVAEGAIERIAGFRFAPFFLVPNFRRGRIRWPQLRAMLGFDHVAFDWRLEHARARAGGADRARRLRFALGRLWSHFTHSRGYRVGVEHMAASRALESRCIVGQDPFINPIAGVATGALNFDHSPTSHPADQIITRQWVAHLLCAPRETHPAATPRSAVQCG